jgi:hypothetical protein
MNFTEWKLNATVKLLEIIKKCEDEATKQELNALLMRLEHLRARDLARFLVDVHKLAYTRKLNQLYEIMPSQEQIKRFFMEER